jgi:N utilization substance protein B
MLSRHNIRVKVLQTLYAHTQDESSTPAMAEINYLRATQSSYKLYLYNLYFLQCIADYARKDYDIKTHKNLPTDRDREASMRLYDNPIIAALRQNENYQKLLRKEMIPHKVDFDFVRILFKKFADSEYYHTYLKMANPPLREHQYCLVNLYKFILAEDVFQEHIDDLFPLWEEDVSLLYGAIKNTIRQLPETQDFYLSFVPSAEFVHDFGKQLLYDVMSHNDELQPVIAEKLRNWDEDRIAIMDMLIIKMAMCELMYHPSVPTKVTLDEYVSIAKEYSTDKSQRFINGILDRIMHTLNEQGKVQKAGRGLQEE